MTATDNTFMSMKDIDVGTRVAIYFAKMPTRTHADHRRLTGRVRGRYGDDKMLVETPGGGQYVVRRSIVAGNYGVYPLGATDTGMGRFQFGEVL